MKRSGLFLVVAAVTVSSGLIGGCTEIAARIIPSHNQDVDTSSIPSGRYEIERPHASLQFKVDHMGYAFYVGRFDRFEAVIEFDHDRPEASRLEVSIDAASINTNDAGIDEILRGRAYFDTARFPKMLFSVNGVTVIDERTGQVTGELTMHGRVRPVSFEVHFNGGAKNFLTGKYTLGFSAEGRLSRSDFGMGTLVPLVGDEVIFSIEAEFSLIE